MSKAIAVLQETRSKETRVAVVPYDVSKLTQLGYSVTVQKNAGLQAGFSDRDYLVTHAKMGDRDLSFLNKSDILLLFKRPNSAREQDILQSLGTDTAMVGFLDPYTDTKKHLDLYQKQKITAFAWELLPNVSETYWFDALARMSWLTGEIVLEDYMTNERENLENKNILIIGLGNAGLACAKFALARKANILAITRNQRYQNLIESQGGKFLQIQGTQLHQRETIAEILLNHSFDLAICCARVRFQFAPLLIATETLLKLKRKMVIYDLAASLGGNCEASQYGKNISCGRVDIRSQTGYPKTRPKLASELYSECMLGFLHYLSRETSDAIAQLCLESCLVCHGMLNPIVKRDRCHPIGEIQEFRDRVLTWHQNYLKTF